MHTSEEIGNEIEKQIKQFQGKKKGIHISGGMDSAIVASYLPGAEAYTFRFLGGNFQGEELARAEYYTNYYGLNLHYVDISWDTVVNHVEPVMRAKAAPVNSIESQILQVALQAKADGVEAIFVGESSDLIFGGMDQFVYCQWVILNDSILPLLTGMLSDGDAEFDAVKDQLLSYSKEILPIVKIPEKGNLIIYGAENIGRATIKKYGSRIKYFADGNPLKAGTYLEGVKIISSDELNQYLKENHMVIAVGAEKMPEAMKIFKDRRINEYSVFAG